MTKHTVPAAHAPLVRDWLTRRRLITIAVVAVVIVGFNVLLYSQNALAHTNSSYASIVESSESGYSGVIALINHYDPDLGSGTFTNSSLWTTHDDTCGGKAWLETGWSKKQSWGGELRHKFMYKTEPYCTFAIWFFNMGSPDPGPFYEYRLVRNEPLGRWEVYVDGALKAAHLISRFDMADQVQAGSELAPPYNGTIDMGPTLQQQLQYHTPAGGWRSFVYQDWYHCDVNPPLNPYNLYHPANIPDWIYMYGPAPGGYCG